MPVETVLRYVDLPADKPFRKKFLPFQNLAPLLLPHEQLRCLPSPEFGRVFNRLLINFPIFSEAFGMGLLGKGFCWFKDSILDQMRLNVVVAHGGLQFGLTVHSSQFTVDPSKRLTTG